MSDGPTGVRQGLRGSWIDWLRQRLRPRTLDELERQLSDWVADAQPGSTTDDAGKEAGRELIANVLSLRELTALDLMVPRADIVAVPCETDLTALLRIVNENGHSRMPVFRETLDNVLGFIHIKDVLRAMSEGGPFVLKDLVRELLIVAPSMRALDLLLEMRRARQQLALVVDEFGGIDGLVTIEDVVEAIVGEIEDEHDTDVPYEVERRPDGTLVIDARLALDEFLEDLQVEISESEREEIDTVGGLVFALAARIPANGERFRHPSGLEFEVLEADQRRIRRLAVRPPAPPEVSAA